MIDEYKWGLVKRMDLIIEVERNFDSECVEFVGYIWNIGL